MAAFGGDQFKLPEQERQLQTFFSVFYFSINAGSLISTFITPIFRWASNLNNYFNLYICLSLHVSRIHHFQHFILLIAPIDSSLRQPCLCRKITRANLFSMYSLYKSQCTQTSHVWGMRLQKKKFVAVFPPELLYKYFKIYERIKEEFYDYLYYLLESKRFAGTFFLGNRFIPRGAKIFLSLYMY